MNSPRLSLLKNLSLLVFSGGLATALVAHPALSAEPEPPTTITPPTPTTQEALAFLRVDKVKLLCAQPIALKVDNASADTIVAQVRRVLSTNKSLVLSKVPIEIRGVKSVSLTFNAKNSTVSKILSSTARLGNAELWVLGDHLLLAPAESLTSAEQEAIKKGFATSSNTGDPFSETEQRRIWSYSLFIADELKANTTDNLEALKSREQRKSKTSGSVLANATMGQLSPDAQAMLQELLSKTLSNSPQSSPLSSPNYAQIAFNPNTPVEIIQGTGANSRYVGLEAFVKNADDSEFTLRWSMNGGNWGARYSGSSSSHSVPPSPPTGAPPLDLSAGKS